MLIYANIYKHITAENFTARLKQANLVTKTDFDKKLTNFNRKITSNKTKCLEVQRNLNSLITKDFPSRKSNGLYNSKFRPLYTAFLIA